MQELDYDRDEARMRRCNRPLIVERAVSELQGLATAVIYDGVVENSEITLLCDWLGQYAEESAEWPMKQLRGLIEGICEDGIITPEERQQLFTFLKDFATGPDEDPIVGGIYDDTQLVFPRRLFLFTGKLRFGPRKKAQESVIARGGELTRSVTRNLNYLVCGDLGNANYRQSRFGNKIAAAIAQRDGGQPGLYIVRESAFVEAIMGTGA